MKAKILLFLLTATVLLYGCVSRRVIDTDNTEIKSETNAISAEVSSAPRLSTEPAEPTVQTVPIIDIPVGSHQCRFYCEETDDYLDYYLFVPQNAVAGMPLIIFLHGDGEVGKIESLEFYGPIQGIRDIYGDDFPFIMISPCTREQSWTSGIIPQTLMALIESIVAECRIDPEHVIVTGHSRGAMGVWYLISEYGDFFSAAVPVSCGTDTLLNYENVSKVPVYALAGDVGTYENDYRYTMERLVSAIQEHNGVAFFQVLEGSGHADTSSLAYTQELFEWMLEQ